jgi:hypothetical protein
MAISALGYVCVRARDLPAWERFATTVLGLQAQTGADGALLLRADSRGWRFRIEQGDEDDVTIVGWECSSEADYLATLAKLGDRATINPALAASRNSPIRPACPVNFTGARPMHRICRSPLPPAQAALSPESRGWGMW